MTVGLRLQANDVIVCTTVLLLLPVDYWLTSRLCDVMLAVRNSETAAEQKNN